MFPGRQASLIVVERVAHLHGRVFGEAFWKQKVSVLPHVPRGVSVAALGGCCMRAVYRGAGPGSSKAPNPRAAGKGLGGCGMVGAVSSVARSARRFTGVAYLETGELGAGW
jgi:hypothetical protein